MKVVDSVKELQEALGGYRREGKVVGFVPTMGALHAGHLELVKEAKNQCDLVVCSVFVNKEQFNDPQDYALYPRDLSGDRTKLSDAGADLLFSPEDDDVYPENLELRNVDLEGLGKVMEAHFRPGHFDGVVKVVQRLFDIVQPDKAYFGEKDFQQLAIIRKLNKNLGYGIEIMGYPTVRDMEGLALSSRNSRLSATDKAHATSLSAALFKLRRQAPSVPLEEAKSEAALFINNTPNVRLEYLDIVDGHSLQSIRYWDESEYVVACVAAWVGDVRLIDNVTIFR